MSKQPLVLHSIFYRVPGLKILDGAYLEAHPGKVTALIGRNGAGKSTLLKIAAGQLKAASGITLLHGERIHAKSLKKRFRSIGYLPQKSMLPANMKVRKILRLIPGSASAEGVSFFEKLHNQKARELSGGERRLLEMLLLFSLKRDYFLLDEPFTGVEPHIIDRIIDRIKTEAGKNRAILLTDHLHRYVVDLADVAYLLHNRQCYKLEGDPATVLKKIGYIK